MRVRTCASLFLAASGLIAAPLSAQTPPAIESPAPAPAPAAASLAPLLPANAVVELEMVDTVASDVSKPGDFFHMRVSVPLASQGRVLVPAGTVAVGQVVHAQKAGGGGKAGELILAARYLELPQGQVKLRSTLGAAGADRIRSSLVVSLLVGIIGMTVKGQNVAMPTGAALSARIAADTPITPAPATADVTTATSQAQRIPAQ
jgi:hypothetical protein